MSVPVLFQRSGARCFNDPPYWPIDVRGILVQQESAQVYLGSRAKSTNKTPSISTDAVRIMRMCPGIWSTVGDGHSAR